MKLIDFDEKFSLYLLDWMKTHESEYKNADEMEADIPHVYTHFINEPFDWLDHKSPLSFFAQFKDFASILQLMQRYLEADSAIPDLLLERLFDSARDTELISMLSMDNELAMLAISALREKESLLPMKHYIDMLLKPDCDMEIKDNILESLDAMGDAAYAPLMQALPQADDDTQEGILSILSRFPFEEETFKTLLSLFVKRRDKSAVLCSYIARMGDDRALPLLIQRAQDENTAYIDYIELRSAIEALGGEAPEREFDEAPYVEYGDSKYLH